MVLLGEISLFKLEMYNYLVMQYTYCNMIPLGAFPVGGLLVTSDIPPPTMLACTVFSARFWFGGSPV